MNRLVEIRAYRLKPGASRDFQHTFVTRALPMLKAAGIEVVAFGPSLQGADGGADDCANDWFLMRAFDDLAHLRRQEDAFYASDAWRDGPREAIVGAIEHYLDTLVWMSDEAIDDVRRLNAADA